MLRRAELVEASKPLQGRSVGRPSFSQNHHMRILRVITIVVIAVIAAVMVVQSDHDRIELAAHCPPGFELTDKNECKCRNLYQQYEPLRNSG